MGKEFTEEYWGRILGVTNDGIRFQVDCTGKIVELKWKVFDLRASFSAGCSAVDVPIWGDELIDCKSLKLKRPFRIFHYGNVDFDDFTTRLDYDDKTGELKFDQATYPASRARKLKISIWMECNIK